MANKLDFMDLKQIITLHLDGFSNRRISTTLGLGRNTINGYLQQFKASNLPMKELLDLDEASLKEFSPSRTTIDNDRFNDLMQYFEQVNQARNHPGFTFLYHYQEYKHQYQNPYSYTQFMEHYNRKYAKIKGTMKLEHKAGNEIFIDFAGKKLHITDKTTGEIEAVEVFEAILYHQVSILTLKLARVKNAKI